MSDRVLTNMVDYLAVVQSTIEKLYYHPFYFNDESVEKTLRTVKSIYRIFLDNANKLAERSQLSVEKAALMLINGKAEYPDFNGVYSVPTVFDVAASINNWILFIDDDEREHEKLKRIFGEKKIGVLALSDEKQFLETVKQRPYLQYWVDLGLGRKGKVEIGIDLIKGLKKIREKKRQFGEIVVYTHHNQGDHMHEIENEAIINKTSRKTPAKIRNYSKNVLDSLEKNSGFHPANPLIALVD